MALPPTDAWFARRTHRWQDWTLTELVEAKRAGGTRVSLVVPARNEAATVGDVVTRLREALMDTAQLVDEVVVIDSDSTDDTFAVAEGAGFRERDGSAALDEELRELAFAVVDREHHRRDAVLVRLQQ